MRITGDVQLAAELLRRGEIVAFPTETTYGLGADARNAAAVAKIFEAKRRPSFDPLIVHIADVSELESLVFDVPPGARALIEAFWPGPLSIVLPKRPVIPDLVTSGLATVAIRLPAHPVARALIRAAAAPLAAPSANLFGRISPTTAQHVVDQLGDRAPLVLDDGPCQIGLESTVVAFLPDVEGRLRPALLRPGGLPQEEIEALIGPLLPPRTDDRQPSSPGQLTSHYAPRTPLRIEAEGWAPAADSGRRVGLLSWRPPAPGVSLETFAVVEILSPRADLRQAAAQLFAAMRRLDAAALDELIAWPAPDQGLGRAIMDRLRRAAARAE